MKTGLIHIDYIPDETELVALLGVDVYGYYNKLCGVIGSSLAPDLEVWDRAGRRGKYFHGYRITKQSMTVDLYLRAADEQGYITCNFHFVKRYFSKIVNTKELFREQIQRKIDYGIKFNEEFGGGYPLEVIIGDETDLHDAIKIIEVVSR